MNISGGDVLEHTDDIRQGCSDSYRYSDHGNNSDICIDRATQVQHIFLDLNWTISTVGF